MDNPVEDGDVFVENGQENLEGIRKNLLDDFETAKTVSKMLKEVSKISEREPVKVFLRVRPFTSKELSAGENQGCLEIENMSSVVMHPPKTSFTFKHQTRNAVTAETIHRFTFSRVYGPQTTQKVFFEDTSLSLVKDFIDGQNALMFCYGVTNAGKTYTVLGTPDHVGILPRTINILFNSFKEKNYDRSNLKPKMFCDVQKLSSIQEEREDSKKRLLLSLIDISTYHNSVSSCSDLSLQDISNVHTSANEDTMNISSALDVTSVDVEIQGSIQFSVWISFAEVYNEQIFDLLEPISLGQPRKRTVLKVGDDRKGNPYIKGLTEIHVNNAEEALKLLKIGRKNQKIASTKLNENSSRSHCIFTLKILRVVNKKDPHVARVSRLSFVDLAGSERYTKTQNTGVRLKEAGNINTSIMTLGKCVELLRYNQNHINNPKNIPFRESKLTRLLQGFFCGKGKASMVVNVNQCASAFDETLHALKFSAIAKKVTTQVQAPISLPEAVPEVRSERDVRMSVPWADGASSAVKKSCNSNNDDQEEPLAPLAVQEESDISNHELKTLVTGLQQQLVEEKKKLMYLEVKIRQEVSEEMAQQIVEIENNYTERLLEDEKKTEDLYEKRMDILMKSVKRQKKRPRVDHVEDDDDEWVSSVLLHQEKVKVQELNEKVVELEKDVKERRTEFESEVEKLNHQLSERVGEIESLKKDVDEQLAGRDQEIGLLKEKCHKEEEQTKDLSLKVEQMGKELVNRDEMIESLKKDSRTVEKELRDQKEALCSEVQQFREKLVEKEKEIQSLKKDCNMKEELRTKNETLFSELEKLREELVARDGEIQSMKKDRDGIEAKNMSDEVAKLRKELSCREEELKSFRRNEDGGDVEKELKKKTELLSCEIKKLQQDLSCRDEIIESLKKDCEEKDKDKLENVSCEIEKLRKELASRDRENECLKVTVKDCKLELETKTTQLMSVKKVQGGRLGTPTKTPTKTGTKTVNNNLVKQLEKRLEETTTALDKKNSQLIIKNSCIEKLEDLLKDAKKDLDDQEKELRELRVAKELLAREKNRVDDKKVEEMEEKENQLRELGALLNLKNKENEEVSGNLKFVEGELDILQNNGKEKEIELVRVKQDYKTLQAEVDQLKEKVNKSNEEVNCLKTDLQKSNEIKQDIEKELQQKALVSKDARVELENMKISNESKERELQRREIKITSLTETIEGLTKELTQVHENYKSLQETNKQVLSDLVSVQATVDVRNEELQQFEIQDKTQKDANREIQTEIMSLRRDLETARNELKLKENEQSQIKDDYEIRIKQEVLKVKEECEIVSERMKIGLAEQDEVLSQMEKEMITKEEEVGELHEEVEQLKKEVQEQNEKSKKLGEDNVSLDDQRERLKINVFELEAEVVRLEKELKKERSHKGRDMTKALKEGLEVAKAKKGEYEKMKVEYEEMKQMVMKEREEQKIAFENKIKDLEVHSQKCEESDEKTTSAKDTASSCPSDSNEDIIADSEYKPVEVESFDFPAGDRVEIDVTPVTGSGLWKGGKKKTLKRRSSDLTLKEIKEMSEKKKKLNNEQSDSTPVSTTKLRTRKTRSSSVNTARPHLKRSIVPSPSSFSLPAFDENSENVRPPEPAKAVSGPRRFLSKLGIHESPKSKSEKVVAPKTSEPHKKRKLLKKSHISAPITDSSHSQSSDNAETPNTAWNTRTQDIITRHLRSRVVKSTR